MKWWASWLLLLDHSSFSTCFYAFVLNWIISFAFLIMLLLLLLLHWRLELKYTTHTPMSHASWAIAWGLLLMLFGQKYFLFIWSTVLSWISLTSLNLELLAWYRTCKKILSMIWMWCNWIFKFSVRVSLDILLSTIGRYGQFGVSLTHCGIHYLWLLNFKIQSESCSVYVYGYFIEHMESIHM